MFEDLQININLGFYFFLVEELQRRSQQNLEEDRRYLRELQSKRSDPRYQKMQEFRKKLPSYDMAEVRRSL
jgi:hypothetical protein